VPPSCLTLPYAYRHTYAHRHADAGVDVTVLKELVSRRLLSTTQIYYRLGNNVAGRWSSGSPGCSSIDTAAGLGGRPRRYWTPSTRRAVGAVAVPYPVRRLRFPSASVTAESPLIWPATGG